MVSLGFLFVLICFSTPINLSSNPPPTLCGRACLFSKFTSRIFSGPGKFFPFSLFFFFNLFHKSFFSTACHFFTYILYNLFLFFIFMCRQRPDGVLCWDLRLSRGVRKMGGFYGGNFPPSFKGGKFDYWGKGGVLFLRGRGGGGLWGFFFFSPTPPHKTTSTYVK